MKIMLVLKGLRNNYITTVEANFYKHVIGHAFYVTKVQIGLTVPSCLLRCIFLRLGQEYYGAAEHFISSE
jgi:hypothetical protein